MRVSSDADSVTSPSASETPPASDAETPCVPPPRDRRRDDTRQTCHIPEDLLASLDYSGLAVWVWAEYDSLGKGGVAKAGRDFLAAKAGGGKTSVDDARRLLIAGGYLARSLEGSRRTAKHKALKHPSRTHSRSAPVPSWTLDRVKVKAIPGEGTVRPDAWRIYCRALMQKGRNPELRNMTVAEIGRWVGGSADTGQRRLRELEEAGLVEVIATPGGKLTIRVSCTAQEAASHAAFYAEYGRQIDAEKVYGPPADPGSHPPQIPAVTTADSGSHPPADSGTPIETDVTKADVQGANMGGCCVSSSPSVAARGSEDTQAALADFSLDTKPVILTRNFTVTQAMLDEALALRPDLNREILKERHMAFLDANAGKRASNWPTRWLSWMDDTLTRVPDDFWHTDAMEEWAQREVPAAAEDIERQTERFVGHWTARGTKARNWIQMWGEWMKNHDDEQDWDGLDAAPAVKEPEVYAPKPTPTPPKIGASCSQHPGAALRKTSDGLICAGCWGEQGFFTEAPF